MKISSYYILFILIICKCYISFKTSSPAMIIKSNLKPSILIAPNDNHYVVLGSNSNPEYLFPLYLTVKRWKSLGIRSIICFGVSKAQILYDPVSKFIFERLSTQEAQFLFYNSKLAPTHTLSQTCRLYVSGSDQLNIDDNSVLITSDSDLWPIDLANHLPSNNQKIFAYHSYCCGFTHKPYSQHWFRHYQISTIATTAKIWRKLIGIERGDIQTGDDISLRLYDEFGEKYIKYGRPKPNYSRSWFADQIILSEKLDLYKNQNPSIFEELTIVPINERIIRTHWPENTHNLTISNYKEVHLLNSLYVIPNWIRTLPIMSKLFNETDMKDITDYYCQFMKLYNNLEKLPYYLCNFPL